jgi:hypothetical protein
MSDRRAARHLRLGAIARAGLFVGAASLLTVVILRWIGFGVSPVVVAGTFVAGRLLMYAITRGEPVRAAVGARPADPEHEYAYRFDEGDLLRNAVRRWEQRLEWSDEDPERFALILRPVLAEMADERLRAHHGVTLESNPARARELLAPELWQLLSDPRTPPPRAQEWPAYLLALGRI